MEMNDEEIKKSYKRIFGDVHETSELKQAILTSNEDVRTKIGRKSSRAGLVAALIAVSVLILGGGVVYALNSPSIKEALFTESGEEFDKIFTVDNSEYEFGNHKLIFEGVMFDETFGMGYISMTVLNSDGTLADDIRASEAGMHVYRGHSLGLSGIYRIYNIARTDEIFLYVANTSGNTVYHAADGHIYIKFQKTSSLEENDDIEYFILNKDKWNQMLDEYDVIEPVESVRVADGHYGYSYRSVSDGSVEALLKKYGLKKLEYKPLSSRRIENEEFTIDFCRFGIKIEQYFGEGNGIKAISKIKTLSVKREDGTVIDYIKDWKIIGNVGGGRSKDTKLYCIYYDFIAEEDEDISVIINDVEYK